MCNSAQRVCFRCGEKYTPTGSRQIKCEKCQNKLVSPMRYYCICKYCGRGFMTQYKYQDKCTSNCSPGIEYPQMLKPIGQLKMQFNYQSK